MSLSVACLTRDTSGRLAAILRLYRPLADEIVVAVDDRVLDEATAAVGGIADVVVGIPFRPPVERSLGWLHARCSGDWILRIDDDEIPSAALLAALPALLEQRSLSHAYVPRRWLWGNAASYLDAPPWTPDYQLRLVRNEPSLHWFPGVTHWPVQALGEARYLAEPVYHTDLLLQDRESRERKARDYERAEPGRRVAGLPLNAAFYLPELREELPAAAVPGEDAERIAAVLAAQAERAEVTVERASAADIDAGHYGDPPAEAAYNVRLELAEPAVRLHAGEVAQIDLVVTNEGDRMWAPHGLGHTPVFVSYRWNGAGESLRTALPERLRPHASVRVPVAVAAPSSPGRHSLELDLVHEHVRWFGAGVTVDVDVSPHRRVAILGEDEALQLSAAAALTELRPSLEPVLLTRDPSSASARGAFAALESAHAAVLRQGRLDTLRRGVTFRDVPEGVTELLVVGSPPGRRERFVEWASVRAARRRGLPVAVARSEAELEEAICSLPA